MRIINMWFGLLGLRSSKLRSALTTLGIIIGIGAVIIVVSLGGGLRRYTEKQLEDMSSGIVEARANETWGRPMMIDSNLAIAAGEMGMGPSGPTIQDPLTDTDVEALRRLATEVNGVAPIYETWGQAIYQGEYMPSGQIMGVTPDFLHVFKRELLHGRFITDYDDYMAAPVVVIDKQLADDVFGEGVNPVGHVIRIAGQTLAQNYTIVGVIDSPTDTWTRTSRSLLIPLRTAHLRLAQPGSPKINMLAMRVDSRETKEREYAVAQIATILRARRGTTPGAPETFNVYDTLAWSEQQTQMIQIMTLVLSLIAGISLIVGSIGLMNIMLVSVSERTAEIGVRRAMGARRGDILGQFLAEAVLLSLLGGLLGLGLGIAGSQLTSTLIKELQGMVSVTPDIVVIAVGISSAVGILAGLYPAWHAALLQPTEALRHA
jgi:putative ABC transport system permease protein